MTKYPLKRIKDKNIDMTVYECEETYVYRMKIRDSDGVVTFPDSGVSFSLYDDCGNQLVADDSMITDATETYEYLYSIPTDCRYGEYSVKVRATDGAVVTVFSDLFFVFPWQCLSQIRSVSGIEQRKSIADIDLARIAWDSYQETLAEIYEFHNWERFVCDPNVNLLFNGTNTTVRINICNNDELADRYGDGVVTGLGETSCGTDIYAYWIDSTYARHDAYVTSVDTITGRCTVTQNDGVTAIPANNRGVRVNYFTKYKLWNERLMRKATVLRAAHEVIQRFHELDRVTLADLPSNQAVFLASPDRLDKLYKKTISKIREPLFGGVK